VSPRESVRARRADGWMRSQLILHVPRYMYAGTCNTGNSNEWSGKKFSYTIVCDFTNSLNSSGKVVIAVMFTVLATLAFCSCFGCFHWSKLKYMYQQKRSHDE
jgi:hypothetical protein